jgi:hypothetical protein
MTGPAFEAFLAKLYTDDQFRAQFLTSPRTVASRVGLSAGECEALEKIDRLGLELASASYKRKREGKARAIR